MFAEGIVCLDGRFSFEKPHDVGNGVLGWDANEEVHVIGGRSSFEDFGFFLWSQFPDHVEHLLPIFGYNDDVILTVPCCVG